MKNKYIKSLGGEKDEEVLGSTGRIVSTEESSKDAWQTSLRPQRLDDYIGQTAFKNNLKVYIEAAKGRGESLDHVLLYGLRGSGRRPWPKSLPMSWAHSSRVTSRPGRLRVLAELAAILTTLQEHDVLFIDEIHRLNRSVEEILYSAMEDFALDLVMGKGTGATSVRINLASFTLIGATTRPGSLSAPLRDRFLINHHMEFYEPDELKHIITRAAGILNIEIEESGAAEIARRSRGTPRIANRLLKRIRDFAQIKNSAITAEIASEAMEALHVDDIGLDDLDNEILKCIIYKFNGGPVGVDTISAAVSEERNTIEDVCEPYLMADRFHLPYAPRQDCHESGLRPYRSRLG